VKGERQNSNEMCTRRIFFFPFWCQGVEKRDPFFPHSSSAPRSEKFTQTREGIIYC
jgi:hypothetical protein